MPVLSNRSSTFLFFGDIIFFYISLWLTLAIRYFEIPDSDIWSQHFIPFSILFLVWLVVFFISGLYEKRTSLMKNLIPSTLFKTQVINGLIAVLFFYFIPLFAITPKTNLFIYLGVSLLIFSFWRFYLSEFISPRSKQNSLLIGRGEEMIGMKEELDKGNFGFNIISSINLEKIESVNVQDDIVDQIYSNNISTIIIDTKDDAVLPILPKLYNLMFLKIDFIDAHQVYEYLFNRVPLSLVKHGWFLENVRIKPHIMYDFLKRLMDIFISLLLGLVSLLIYPFVFLAIKIDDQGKVFYVDTRVGKDNKKIRIIKFRSLSEVDKKETKVGKFIRKTRIDELPQIWNVLKGDLSLIGPRPEQPTIAEEYREKVPYYNIRHLIKPGLSGWAQIYHENHPHHGADIEATKEKISYDLFYIKNRSFFLDFKIALKTVKTLIQRNGR
jgi:exopolysaccharide biosynthesis polyprenyl glycosylphosphotransferase